MEEIRFPSLKKLEKVNVNCSYHPLLQNGVCAAQNAYSLKKWLLNRRQLPSVGEDVTDLIYRKPVVNDKVDNTYFIMYMLHSKTEFAQ